MPNNLQHVYIFDYYGRNILNIDHLDWWKLSWFCSLKCARCYTYCRNDVDDPYCIFTYQEFNLYLYYLLRIECFFFQRWIILDGNYSLHLVLGSREGCEHMSKSLSYAPVRNWLFRSVDGWNRNGWQQRTLPSICFSNYILFGYNISQKFGKGL